MLKPLTHEDLVRVTLATRGECYAHRRWPGEVVKAFASARVIAAGEPPSRDAPARLFRRVLSLAPFST